MSCYLSSDLHTAVVAILTVSHGYAKSVRRTMTALRRLNNAALAHRYGDKPVRLRTPHEAIKEAEMWIAQASPSELVSVVAGFSYQCNEGDVMDCKLGRKLIFLAETLQRKAVASGDTLKSFVWSI